MLKFMNFCWISKLVSAISLIGTIGLANVSFSQLTLAQPQPDRTLEVESSKIISPGNNSSPGDLIVGGASRGNNLFHSFKDFNVNNGQSVYFDNPVGIARIFSRITGSNPSQILGTLGVWDNFNQQQGAADLFFINPNGILFGRDARLDLGGSFIASTASSINFADGKEFSASDPSNSSLLTVSIPIGLQFRTGVGAIQDKSLELAVRGGRTLALVGGEETIAQEVGNERARIVSGSDNEEGGRIELGAVGTNESISLQSIPTGWSLGYENVRAFANINLLRLALIKADGGANFGSGEVQIQGKNISFTEGAQVANFNAGTQPGGKVVIRASETLNTGRADPILGRQSGVGNLAVSSGRAGEIEITARNLRLSDGSAITTQALQDSSGESGNITITIAESIELMNGSAITASTFGQGKAGDVNILARDLKVLEGSEISSATGGSGKGGNVVIDAPFIEISGFSPVTGGSSFISAESQPGATGSGGNLTINTGSLRIADGAIVSVSGTDGQAGNLKITGNSLTLNQGTILAETGKSGVEGGANITLQFRDLLRLENESLISATANGDANGGNIDIDPTFVLIFPPTGPNGSDIIAKAERGNGGKINISTQGLFGTAQRKSSDGNRSNDIDASSEFGASGQVQINGTVDPNQGVAQIPETVVDPNALVSQSPCKRGAQSQFTRTGRGGLPPNLSDDLSGESTQVGLVKPAPSVVAEGQAQKISSGVAPNENQTAKIENPIVPAQGWSFNDNGEVVLTAYNPAVTGPQRLQENPVGCPAL
jgi:filamentous hemagglutinin family protein